MKHLCALVGFILIMGIPLFSGAADLRAEDDGTISKKEIRWSSHIDSGSSGVNFNGNHFSGKNTETEFITSGRSIQRLNNWYTGFKERANSRLDRWKKKWADMPDDSSSDNDVTDPPAINDEGDDSAVDEETEPAADEEESGAEEVSGNRARVEELVDLYFAGQVTMADVEAMAAENGVDIDAFDIDAWAAGNGFYDLDNLSEAEVKQVVLALYVYFTSDEADDPPVDNDEGDDSAVDEETEPAADEEESGAEEVSGNRARVEELVDLYFAGQVTMADVEAMAAENGVDIDAFDIDAWAAGNGFYDLDNLSEAEVKQVVLALYVYFTT